MEAFIFQLFCLLPVVLVFVGVYYMGKKGKSGSSKKAFVESKEELVEYLKFEQSRGKHTIDDLISFLSEDAVDSESVETLGVSAEDVHVLEEEEQVTVVETKSTVPDKKVTKSSQMQAADLLLYLGATIFMFAVVVLISFDWQLFAGWFKILILLVSTGAFYSLGLWLNSKKKFERPGRIMLLIGIGNLLFSGLGIWNFGLQDVLEPLGVRFSIFWLIYVLLTSPLVLIVRKRFVGKFYQLLFIGYVYMAMLSGVFAVTTDTRFRVVLFALLNLGYYVFRTRTHKDSDMSESTSLIVNTVLDFIILLIAFDQVDIVSSLVDKLVLITAVTIPIIFDVISVYKSNLANLWKKILILLPLKVYVILWALGAGGSMMLVGFMIYSVVATLLFNVVPQLAAKFNDRFSLIINILITLFVPVAIGAEFRDINSVFVTVFYLVATLCYWVAWYIYSGSEEKNQLQYTAIPALAYVFSTVFSIASLTTDWGRVLITAIILLATVILSLQRRISGLATYIFGLGMLLIYFIAELYQTTELVTGAMVIWFAIATYAASWLLYYFIENVDGLNHKFIKSFVYQLSTISAVSVFLSGLIDFMNARIVDEAEFSITPYPTWRIWIYGLAAIIFAGNFIKSKKQSLMSVIAAIFTTTSLMALAALQPTAIDFEISLIFAVGLGFVTAILSKTSIPGWFGYITLIFLAQVHMVNEDWADHEQLFMTAIVIAATFVTARLVASFSKFKNRIDYKLFRSQSWNARLNQLVLLTNILQLGMFLLVLTGVAVSDEFSWLIVASALLGTSGLILMQQYKLRVWSGVGLVIVIWHYLSQSVSDSAFGFNFVMAVPAIYLLAVAGISYFLRVEKNFAKALELFAFGGWGLITLLQSTEPGTGESIWIGIILILVSIMFIIRSVLFTKQFKLMLWLAVGILILELLVRFYIVFVLIPWWLYLGLIGIGIIALAIFLVYRYSKD